MIALPKLDNHNKEKPDESSEISINQTMDHFVEVRVQYKITEMNESKTEGGRGSVINNHTF